MLLGGAGITLQNAKNARGVVYGFLIKIWLQSGYSFGNSRTNDPEPTADEAGNYLWELPWMPQIGLSVEPSRNSRKANVQKRSVGMDTLNPCHARVNCEKSKKESNRIPFLER